MTDLIFRRPREFNIQLPAILILGFGQILIRMAEAVGRAYAMAYVDPFRPATHNTYLENPKDRRRREVE